MTSPSLASMRSQLFLSPRALLSILLVFMTPLLCLDAVSAADLPDLDGREIVVVTENAYPPLQFVDPKSGDAIGWEYDAMKELASRLNLLW